MVNLERIATGLNVKPLQEALERQSHLWLEETTRQEYPGSAHRDTRCIFLRWARSRTVEAGFTEIPAVNYPAMNKFPEVSPILVEASIFLDFHFEASKVGRIIITELKPGGFIDPHVDEGAYADHYERFHIVVKSKEGNRFFVEDKPEVGEFAHMREGELWWFNHKKRHYVFNGSNEPRIHLIVDAVVPAFRRERDNVEVPDAIPA